MERNVSSVFPAAVPDAISCRDPGVDPSLGYGTKLQQNLPHRVLLCTPPLGWAQDRSFN